LLSATPANVRQHTGESRGCEFGRLRQVPTAMKQEILPAKIEIIAG
jgi:hypothetical protein